MTCEAPSPRLGAFAAAALGLCILASAGPARGEAARPGPLYTFALSADTSPEAYDEAIAASTLQGVINRAGPEVYLTSHRDKRPAYWLDLFSHGGRWLEGREERALPDLEALVRLAGPRLRGAVIWDPAVPATVNVATTAAGVLDGVVLSPALAERLKPSGLKVLLDLRGRFTGSETGSAKNDAYRWAVREYLQKGLCSAHRLCLFEDAFGARARGDVGYALTRDWAVFNRSFVFDLSPWDDEVPGDDPGQRLGLDHETYRMILEATRRNSAGRQATELTGFFVFNKYSNVPGHASAHEPVPTEWETVWLITPYNFYQCTASSDCFNQSLHSQAPRTALHQRSVRRPVPLSNKAYVCIFMADYDSTTPLYDFFPDNWGDPARGSLPLAWGINPNLLESYPDIISYAYATATAEDTFTADASAAGYTNPNRIPADGLPLFVAHNRRFFAEADMDVAPMVLDYDQPSAAVKDAFLQFAPAGMGTIVYDFHNRGGKAPVPHVWKGMPVVELINDAGEPADAQKTGERMAQAMTGRGVTQPGFYFFRIVWSKPSTVVGALDVVRAKLPGTSIEVVDVHTFLSLFRQHAGQSAGTSPGN